MNMLGEIVRIVLTFSRKKVFCPGNLDAVCVPAYTCAVVRRGGTLDYSRADVYLIEKTSVTSALHFDLGE